MTLLPHLHLVTVLFAQGFPLVNPDWTEPSSCQFVFRNLRLE